MSTSAEVAAAQAMATIQEGIRDHGWAVVTVKGDKASNPFAYTVGHYVAGLEFVVVGLEPDVATRLLENLHELRCGSWQPSPGAILSGLLDPRVDDQEREHEQRVRFDLLKPSQALELYAANALAPQRVTAWQVVYPDAEGRLPGEDGCDLGVVAMQVLS